MNVIFLGPPGAGKGTQAQIICHHYGIPQISTGDMLRAAIANQTLTGMKAKEYMDKGQLVPDQVVIDIVKERLSSDDCKKGYILDGFPRTVAQAEALDQIVSIDVVIDLDVADEELIERLSGRRVCPDCGAPYHVHFLKGKTDCENCGGTLIQRSDDHPDTIRSRLEVYHQKTAPLIDYYQRAEKLCPVKANGEVHEITEAILAAIEAKA